MKTERTEKMKTSVVLKKTLPVVVINGKGGVGKDTLINSLESETTMRVGNISSIDPIRAKCAEFIGHGGEKTNEYRKLLADLKKAYDSYYVAAKGISYTDKYLIDESEAFIENAFDNMGQIPTESAVLFVHIREAENITSYVNRLKAVYPEIKVATLLVQSTRAKDVYGNASDDNVEDYNYTNYFDADDTETQNALNFKRLIYQILDKKPSQLIEEGKVYVRPFGKNGITEHSVFAKVISIDSAGIKVERRTEYGFCKVGQATFTPSEFAEYYEPVNIEMKGGE